MADQEEMLQERYDVMKDLFFQVLVRYDDLSYKYHKDEKLVANSEGKMFKELDNPANLDEIRHLKATIKQVEDLYKELQDRYIALEARFEEATRPPPPPPPPPPPSLTTKSKGFLSKVSEEKKQLSGVKNVHIDTYMKAVNEIMERINSGKPLTPGSRVPPRQRPSETAESETGAMLELNNILKKMKRTQSEAGITSMASGEAREESSADTPSEPAFAFTLKKRSASVDASVPEKKEEQPEFLTANFKLKGGHLKQLLNPMDEENN